MISKEQMPAVFVAHGSPMFGIDAGEYGEALARFGERFRNTTAIVIVSAHWEAPGPVRVNAVAHPDLIYDFGGFPRALYELKYPAPGSPELAEEAVRILSAAGLDAVPERRRGWDHGVWIALRLAYPEAKIPVVEVSLPLPRDPQTVVRMGAALAPLRRSGVLLLGSGGVVHNLRLARLDQPDGPVDDWARRFDEWVRERVERRRIDELVRYRDLALDAALAVPESEHFDPLFFALGAAGEGDETEELYSGFQYANLSLTSVAFIPRNGR